MCTAAELKKGEESHEAASVGHCLKGHASRPAAHQPRTVEKPRGRAEARRAHSPTIRANL